MIRSIVLALVLFVVGLSSSFGSTVGCAATAAQATSVVMGGNPTYPSYYAFTFQQGASAIAFSDYSLGTNYWKGLFIQEHVNLGDDCTGAQQFVVLTRSDYVSLANGAQVVAKIQEQMDLGVVGLACVAVIAGFYCGYRMVQRGGSQ